MAALTSVLPILASMAPDAASSCVASAVAALVQQAVERIARMRQVNQPLGLMQALSQSLILVWKGPHGCELSARPAGLGFVLGAQAAGSYLQALLECQPVLQGVPQRAALSAALSGLGPDGCASLKVLIASSSFHRFLAAKALQSACLKFHTVCTAGMSCRCAVDTF
jgi:hypothetical protein